MGIRKYIISFVFIFFGCVENKNTENVSLYLLNGDLIFEYNSKIISEVVDRIEIFEYSGSQVFLTNRSNIHVSNNKILVPIRRVWMNPTDESKFVRRFTSNSEYEIQIHSERSGYREFFHVFIGNPINEPPIDLLGDKIRNRVEILIVGHSIEDGP